jgi:hypothetical protein
MRCSCSSFPFFHRKKSAPTGWVGLDLRQRESRAKPIFLGAHHIWGVRMGGGGPAKFPFPRNGSVTFQIGVFGPVLALLRFSSVCRLRPRLIFARFAVERGGVGSYMQGTGAMHPACLEVS